MVRHLALLRRERLLHLQELRPAPALPFRVLSLRAPARVSRALSLPAQLLAPSDAPVAARVQPSLQEP